MLQDMPCAYSCCNALALWLCTCQSLSLQTLFIRPEPSCASVCKLMSCGGVGEAVRMRASYLVAATYAATAFFCVCKAFQYIHDCGLVLLAHADMLVQCSCHASVAASCCCQLMRACSCSRACAESVAGADSVC